MQSTKKIKKGHIEDYISSATQTALDDKEDSIGYIPENEANKTTTVIGNEASTSLYLNILGAVTYFQQKLTDSILGTFLLGLTAKNTPIDADTISYVNSVDGKSVKTTLSNWFTNWLKPKTDALYGVQGYDTISSSRSLTDADHDKTIWVTATCNITIPSGLIADFHCSFRTFTGATATFLTSGTTINSESDGDVQAPRTMSYLAVYTTNNYIISGGGLS